MGRNSSIGRTERGACQLGKGLSFENIFSYLSFSLCVDPFGQPTALKKTHTPNPPGTGQEAMPINQWWARAEARCRQTCVQQDISIGEFHRSLLWLQPQQPPVALETASFLSETTAYWALCWLNKRVCLTAVDSCADRAASAPWGDLRRSHPSSVQRVELGEITQ